MVGTNCTGEFARAWFASSNRPPVSIPLLLRRSVRPRCRHSARLPGASVSHGPSRSLTGWGRVFFCGLKRAGRINEQPLQIIHPSSGRRQVSAVTRRRIGSSSLNNETLYNEMLHGGSGQDKILRLRAPAGGTKFSFHRMSQTGPFTAPRLCFTQDARPSVPRPLQAGFRRERGPGVAHCAGAPIFWGLCEPIDQNARVSVRLALKIVLST